MTEEKFFRRIRSFVRRDGRMTDAQRRVLSERWSDYGLNLEDGMIDYAEIFKRKAPCILEIGFGSGHSLLEVARATTDIDYIGIETYQPGIGTLLLGVETHQVTNLRVYYADAVLVLQQCIPNASLDGVQIFFPDPWQKRRHHKRRLIQPEFVKQIAEKIKPGGLFHLATDWEDYAIQMMSVLSESSDFTNLAGMGQFSDRSRQRPIITKFEQRGHHSGRMIWELQFTRNR